MNWVMLTQVNGDRIYVNVERFDLVYEEGGHTIISMVINEDIEEDRNISVLEKPEDILFFLKK